MRIRPLTFSTVHGPLPPMTQWSIMPNTHWNGTLGTRYPSLVQHHTLWGLDANLPEELKCIYVGHLRERTKWDGRPYDYVCLIRFLNRMSWSEKHKALCNVMDNMEKELAGNLHTEADYLKVCGDLKTYNQFMKGVEDIVDVFECHFLPDRSPSGQCLELKYKDYHQYDPRNTKQVVWVSPEGAIVR